MHTVWARERSGENVQRGRAGADSACGMGAESQCVCVGSVGISASAENGVGAGVGTGAAGGVRGGVGKGVGVVTAEASAGRV